MKRMIPAAFVYLLVLLSPADAQSSKTVWTMRERNAVWQSCGDGRFVLSLYPNGMMQGPAMNGGPTVRAWGPYDSGQTITVIGWSVSQWLSDPNATGTWVVGSGHGGDGPDVFAHGGGVGTNHNAAFFPPGLGFPQGGLNWSQSRFDVYGTCSVGQQIMDVLIYYTSP